MIKFTYINGKLKSRRGSVEIESDVEFLSKKNIEFSKVGGKHGTKIWFTNPKGEDVVWKYEID